jgi:hypothetical protein
MQQSAEAPVDPYPWVEDTWFVKDEYAVYPTPQQIALLGTDNSPLWIFRPSLDGLCPYLNVLSQEGADALNAMFKGRLRGDITDKPGSEQCRVGLFSR